MKTVIWWQWFLLCLVCNNLLSKRYFRFLLRFYYSTMLNSKQNFTAISNCLSLQHSCTLRNLLAPCLFLVVPQSPMCHLSFAYILLPFLPLSRLPFSALVSHHATFYTQIPEQFKCWCHFPIAHVFQLYTNMVNSTAHYFLCNWSSACVLPVYLTFQMFYTR